MTTRDSGAPVNVIAQMIRAYEGKGIAAGVFAEAIIDALEKAHYEIGYVGPGHEGQMRDG